MTARRTLAALAATAALALGATVGTASAAPADKADPPAAAQESAGYQSNMLAGSDVGWFCYDGTWYCTFDYDDATLYAIDLLDPNYTTYKSFDGGYSYLYGLTFYDMYTYGL